MLYNYRQLQNLSHNEIKIYRYRYLQKFYKHRKEIKRLKAHDKDFFFNSISTLQNEKGLPLFDLKSIEEAYEYNFNDLILIYFENLNFNKPTKNYLGQTIGREVMKKDKIYFDIYFAQWKKQLESKKGIYCCVIYTELYRRLKELNIEFNEGKIEEAILHYQTKHLYTIAFYIYYKVKLFFDGTQEKFVLLKVEDENIVINIYSYVHTLFRHYFPSMDISFNSRSINMNLPFLDLYNLPLSLRNFLDRYFRIDQKKLTPSREYFLFSYKKDKYIIWLKYYKLKELPKNGFELRTLYRCSEKRDLDKFNYLIEHPLDSNLSFYF